jgi:hypothetical protein
MLAQITQAVIESWEKFHTSPEVRMKAGDATALIMSLRKAAPQHDKV